jgi:two-component system, OmpR family, sensor histidine kinase BaeS
MRLRLPIRLRFVHTLSLLLMGSVLLAVLAMAAVTAWHLRNGFAEYLAARDIERLEQFAELVAEAAERAGGADALRERRLDMRELLDQLARRQGVEPRRGPPPSGGEGFGARVALVSPEGLPLMGRPLPRSDAGFVERPVRVRGELVALARMQRGAAVPDAVELRFLRSQYLGILAVAAALVLLALASAWWLARRWVRPLLAVQDATARIARGELAVRLVGPQQGEARGDEIGDLVRNINHMATGLQRLEGARRRWVADISHELRTPLAVLRGEIEALVDGVRPLRHEAMLSLREEVLRLGALVDDLHLLAMSDLNALPCHFAELDAASLVQRLVQRFEARASAVGLTLQAELGAAGSRPASMSASASASMWVHWDSARIEQLLSNLIENSLRYTDSAGEEPGRIVLTLRRDGPQLVIDINDSAPGVPTADLPRLFEPLYRADVARSRHRGGSGLGLAICQAIVRSHGGTISAGASALGGLHVQIVLPASPGASS